MEEKMTEKSVSKKSILVHFADPVNEQFYKYWSRKFNVPAIDGYKILKRSNEDNEDCEKVKQHQKILLVVTMRAATKDYIKEFEKMGFSDEDIVMFTTQALESEVCMYAKERGIKIVLLPIIGSDLRNFL